MKKTPPCSACSRTADEPTIAVSRLERYITGWLLSGDIAQHTERTIDNRRRLMDQLIWFLRHRSFDDCGVLELRQFFAYLSHGHEEPGGRWGNPTCRKPLRPASIHTYHGHIRTLFGWIVNEGGLASSPMDRIPPPVLRRDQLIPFNDRQLDLLVRCARISKQPKRDEAIVLFLLDTGVRCSEICSLRIKDVDMKSRLCTVVGKGNKVRQVPFGAVCAKALWVMLKSREDQSEDQPLFLGQRSRTGTEYLTRSGLQQMIERLSRAAGIKGVRASPHTFRHTFAIAFLRAGGNVFSLQAMLGHESIDMTRRYVYIAQADVQNQHRQLSPADRLHRPCR